MFTGTHHNSEGEYKPPPESAPLEWETGRHLPPGLNFHKSTMSTGEDAMTTIDG